MTWPPTILDAIGTPVDADDPRRDRVAFHGAARLRPDPLRVVGRPGPGDDDLEVAAGLVRAIRESRPDVPLEGR